MAEQLKIQIRGEGPDLVMLHGWAMHSGIWGRVADGLASEYRLHLVDLPGHGKNHQMQQALHPEVVADMIASQTPPAVWLGWSLGGLISLQAALNYPDHIKALILTAANASFVQQPDWPHGVPDTVFDQFAKDLEDDFSGTLDRFLALETIGSDTAREALRRLRATAFAQQHPSTIALRSGLEVLHNTDLLDQLDRLSQPSLMIAGRRDRLVPPQAMEHMAQRTGGEYHLIRGAGHAPFIGHGDEFMQQVSAFIQQQVLIHG